MNVLPGREGLDPVRQFGKELLDPVCVEELTPLYGPDIKQLLLQAGGDPASASYNVVRPDLSV